MLIVTLPSYAEKEKPQVVVNKIFMNMHTGPGRGLPIFHVIEKGETITLLKIKTDWVKVRTQKGEEGWVRIKDIQETTGINGELVNVGLPDREDYAKRQWEIGLSLGELEQTPSVSLHGGFYLTKNLSAELNFNQATGQSSNSRFISLGLVHQPFPQWRFSPYFKLANGVVKITPNSGFSANQDTEDNFFLVSTGGYYYFTHRIVLRLEFNDYTTLPDRDGNENISEWKLGLTSFF